MLPVLDFTNVPMSNRHNEHTDSDQQFVGHTKCCLVWSSKPQYSP